VAASVLFFGFAMTVAMRARRPVLSCCHGELPSPKEERQAHDPFL
jgi:hypothetical protein